MPKRKLSPISAGLDLRMMSEAKHKIRAHAEILAAAPGCIYCAGENRATTIEHMPPISMFEGRQRPKGLEFPACDGCNGGTRHSDLVAAMLARSWPNPDTSIRQKDAKKYLSAVANNVPGVLQEMFVGRGAELFSESSACRMVVLSPLWGRIRGDNHESVLLISPTPRSPKRED
jgi:hypothetical protein